ncbi:MAG: PaaX family transcriptional regulator C-terminal domain-containing protein [Actinomycetota bacterium]
MSISPTTESIGPGGTISAAIVELLDRYQQTASPSARVLLTTVFGDSLLPRRCAVAVQDLAALMAPLGINERSVRTALQRLATEELVEAERQGRRSYYRVHPAAEATFASAEQRIYHRPSIPWDGAWTIAVLAPGGDAAPDRRRLQQELRWLGLAEVATGVAVSAVVEPKRVSEAAERSGTDGLLAVIRGPLEAGSLNGDEVRRALADPTGDLQRLHRQHLATFEPYVDVATESAVDAWVVRTLVIDSWRRLALRAAAVPDELEPVDWPADEAYELTALLFRRLAPASEHHLDRQVGPGPTPPVRFPGAAETRP